MGNKYAEIMFTQSVQQVQVNQSRRSGNAKMTEGDDYNFQLGQAEMMFISERDSFYMASVAQNDWPYLQHRGGPAGFMKVIDEKTIGFADYSGNRQYISTGNFIDNNKVALFFMDYPNRKRLKLLGRVRTITLDDYELIAQLEDDDYRANIERGFIIDVQAFDWNCPQHITPRYSESQIEQFIAPIKEENERLKTSRQHPPEQIQQVLGEGELQLVVSGVRQLSSRIRSYELRDPSGADLPSFEPGAHLKLPIRLSNGEIVHRHYSICSDPQRRDIYQIAVLREQNASGVSGSELLHEQYHLGIKLACQPPQNNFKLQPGRQPVVLIAGGIGITPIKSMMHSLKNSGREFRLHYAAAKKRDMAFHFELELEFKSRSRFYFSSDKNRMNLEQILSTAPDEAVFYVCGPERLIDAVIDTAKALHVDLNRVLFERFTVTIADNARPISLTLHRSDKKIDVSSEQTILDAMLESETDVAYSCRGGTCKTCAVKVLDGEPEHLDSALSDYERNELNLFCPCISRALSDHLILDI